MNHGHRNRLLRRGCAELDGHNRVRDLDKLAAQLQGHGIAVKIDPENYPNGRFARLHDPEGNPIELWQPADPGKAP